MPIIPKGLFYPSYCTLTFCLITRRPINQILPQSAFLIPSLFPLLFYFPLQIFVIFSTELIKKNNLKLIRL
jgi:hypothetical protein